MEKSTHMGMNRTGAQMAPRLTPDMVEFAERGPVTEATGPTFQGLKRVYARESEAVGSVPLPGTVKGAAAVGIQKLTGGRPEILIDKLGERLAFERSGARLYEALVLKCEESPLDLPIARLREIRDEELAHFHLVKEVLEMLGADPTAQTPCADVAAVASQGLMQVVNDPRTDVPQALNAILTAELTDNAAWELLVDLARDAGLDEVVERFEEAQDAEAEHLVTIEGLLRIQLGAAPVSA